MRDEQAVMSAPVGVICGLQSEAARLPYDGRLLIGVSGARPENAAAIAAAIADDGAQVLISFGISGALDPGLAPGDLLLASDVVTPTGERFEASPELLASLKIALQDAGLAARRTVLLGSDDLVATPARKATLFAETRAVAVDMESHAVARVAAERGLPFAALRAVADAHDRALPDAARDAVSEEGGTRIFSVLAALARRPDELGALLKLGGDSQKAHGALKRAAPAFAAALLA